MRERGKEGKRPKRQHASEVKLTHDRRRWTLCPSSVIDRRTLHLRYFLHVRMCRLHIVARSTTESVSSTRFHSTGRSSVRLSDELVVRYEEYYCSSAKRNHSSWNCNISFCWKRNRSVQLEGPRVASSTCSIDQPRHGACRTVPAWSHQ